MIAAHFRFVFTKALVVTPLAPDALNRSGGSWGPDGRVTFARNNGLWQVPAEGGAARQVTTLTVGEVLHAWPTIVNDGKVILFTSVPSGGVQHARVASRRSRHGQEAGAHQTGQVPAPYLQRHLVFYREGGLYAAAFDAGRLTVTGPPLR